MRDRFLRFHPPPVRRVAFSLAAAAVAHAVLAVIAVGAWTGEATGFADLAVLTPVVVTNAGVALLPLVGFVAAVLAVLAARAAVAVVRLHPHAERTAESAAWASLLNPPVGTLFGLLALAQLDRPRTRSFLRAAAWREKAG